MTEEVPPLDLRALLREIEQIAPPAGQHLIAFVRRLELSPSTMARVRTAAKTVISAADGEMLFGIPVSDNSVLPDHHALIRFGDGRIGTWDLRTNLVTIIPPPIELTPRRERF